MTTYRVIPLGSLADDLEEVLVPTDYESSVRPIPSPAARLGERRCACGAPKAPTSTICTTCQRERRPKGRGRA